MIPWQEGGVYLTYCHVEEKTTHWGGAPHKACADRRGRGRFLQARYRKLMYSAPRHRRCGIQLQGGPLCTAHKSTDGVPGRREMPASYTARGRQSNWWPPNVTIGTGETGSLEVDSAVVGQRDALHARQVGGLASLRGIPKYKNCTTHHHTTITTPRLPGQSV